MAGVRADEYLITIVLNKHFSQTRPPDAPPARLVSPLTPPWGKPTAKVSGADDTNGALPCLLLPPSPGCLLLSFAPTPSQKASHFSGNVAAVEGSQKVQPGSWGFQVFLRGPQRTHAHTIIISLS